MNKYRSKRLKVETVSIDQVTPSPENDLIYDRVTETDPEFERLVGDIALNGIREPIVITKDGFIISGHRRYAAGKTAGLKELPVRRETFSRSSLDDDEFLELLTSFNAQRNKTPGERVRELQIRSSPKPHQQIVAARLISRKTTDFGVLAKTDGSIHRAQISERLKEFLEAVQHVVDSLEEYWPISERQIHYRLLNDPPMVNNSTGIQRHRYGNDKRSTKALSNLLTRARIAGLIPMIAISDETRPETIWNVHPGFEYFLDDQINNIRAGYSRDLMIGQPHHIEIVAEKLTVKNYVHEIAMRYCIPVTIARGKCSLPPRANIYRRWTASNKDKLIVICVADLDPDGIVITDMWHKSLIGDFGVPKKRLKVIRSGVNKEHIERFSLPPNLSAKTTSPTFRKFKAEFGANAYELEALSPEQLQELLHQTIESVIDRPAYEQQVKAEEIDAGLLDSIANDIAYHFVDSD